MRLNRYIVTLTVLALGALGCDSDDDSDTGAGTTEAATGAATLEGTAGDTSASTSTNGGGGSSGAVGDAESSGGGTSNANFREDCGLPAPTSGCYNGTYCDEHNASTPGGMELAEEAYVDTGMQFLSECPGPHRDEVPLGGVQPGAGLPLLLFQRFPWC